ncbi:THAP domain-containing protein 1-like [Battus philenor]|uniref:THAP domain-containing protein 1-like n=1 Tax=Battus philenor TaxID=42288 RepID=UPI0035D02995
MNFNQALLKMKEVEDNKSKQTPVAMVAPELKQNTEADTEITKTCAVLGCEESKNLNSDSFFRFPEDANLRQIWTDLTGRNNWTPTDFSYICVQHFSVDCFECDSENRVVLISKAVPSLKLPNHVLEVEYIDEETLDHDEDDEEEYDMESDQEHYAKTNRHTKENHIGSTNERNIIDDENVELLKLFTEVQRMQRQAISLRDKLKCNMRVYNRQNRFLGRLKKVIEMKKNILEQKRKKKARILLLLQDKIKEDTNGLVLAMPMKHTDDLKNFALSIYKYSPQAYIYIRNTLRTMLPSTDVLESWLNSGYEARNVLSSSTLLKVVSEQTDSELLCRVSIR